MPGAETPRVRPVLAVLVAGLVTLLLPSLVATSFDVPAAVLMTAVAALVATVSGVDHRATTLANSLRTRHVRRTRGKQPFLAARVTDTTRHPLRPRAPGLV